MTVIAAVTWSVAMLGVGPGGAAGACACGAIVSHDPDAQVTGEQVLVAIDGTTETIVMRLDVQSVTADAALIVPTPAPATATQASQGLFPELERLTAPHVDPSRTGLNDSDEVGALPGGAPTVVAQVQLGPLEATTLTGGDLAGVRGWLDGHGYHLRPDVSARLEPYLHQGWSFVAMRLTGEKPLAGQLDPVRLDFASPSMVYPMRLSAAARDVQRVVVYTLAGHRMQRTDADAPAQNPTVDFAGSIAGRTADETLTELSAVNPFLTRISTVITDPASITTDFTFGPAPTDATYQRVLPDPAAPGATAGLWAPIAVSAVVAALAAATIATLVLRNRSRGNP